MVVVKNVRLVCWRGEVRKGVVRVVEREDGV